MEPTRFTFQPSVLHAPSISFEETNVYKILVGNFEVKRLLGRQRRRWEEMLEWVLKKYGVRKWSRLT